MLLKLAGVLAALLAVQYACGELVIENADRQIVASSQRVNSATLLTIKNTGSAPVEAITICELASLKEHAAMFEVGYNADGKFTQLFGTPEQPAGAPAGMACTSYPLHLAAGASASLAVKAVFTRVLQPHPAHIAQGEPQRVLLEVGLYISSPYRVATQSTGIELGNKKVEARTKVDPSTKKGSELTYGPYPDKEPFAEGELRVHYENNAPFAEATELVREIEVSHWGNVYFEEQYALVNAGAKAKGEWSRMDYMVKPEFSRAAIKELQAQLMPASHSLYFRDGIGNISSSAARFAKDGVYVGLVPRFPLFGGWSARFLFGWSLPLPVAVSTAPGGEYKLSSLIGPSIQDLVVDDLVVQVVLPEGATFLNVDCQLDLEVSFDKKYTYFDVLGRTVVVLRKHNVVPEQNVPFTVTYTYPRSAMMQKPVMLVAAFAALFAVLMAYSRSDFRINGKGASVAKTHVS